MDGIPRLVPWLLVAAFTVNSCGEEQKTSDAVPAAPGPLELRMSFPSVDLVSVDGRAVNTKTLIQDRETIVFFVSLSCQSCEELIQTWTELTEDIPAGLNLFAVTDEEAEFAGDFLQENPFPFPLYCDEKDTFGTRHQVNVFPTVVGTTSEGKIAFLGKAVTPLFTPKKAMSMFEEVKGAREGS